MYCKYCGARLADDARFCSSCGQECNTSAGESKPSDVLLKASELRVPYASITSEQLLAIGEEGTLYAVDSHEARTANTPFDPSRIPTPDQLVPADCVWAMVPHPGSFVGETSYGSIDKRFVAMGNLQGRTFAEISAVVGTPMTNMTNGNTRSAVWGKTGMFSIWQIGLNFDRYNVCIGIFSQTNL